MKSPCLIAALVVLGLLPAPAQTQDKSAAPPQSMAVAFYGVWRDTNTHNALVIDALYPDDPRKVEQLAGRTQNRRTGKAEGWGGLFIAAHGSTPDRLTLTRLPHVEEMNPKIPEWARQKLVNKLKWQLDLDLDTSNPFDPQLKGMFYPGAVQWTEGSPGAVKITGKGDGIPITFEPDRNIELTGLVAPVIEFDYRNRHPMGPRPRYLLKGDAFKIMVTLPGPLAQKQGLTLPLVFHALQSGGTASIELDTGRAEQNDPVVSYAHRDEITLANRGDAQDKEPLFGLFPPAGGFGPRLNLSVKNGEEVEMAAAGATYRFRIFDTLVDLALARRADAISDLLLPMEGGRENKTDPAEIKDLTMRIRMGRTALKIAADSSMAADVRLMLLSEYLGSDGQTGLLQDKGLHWIPETDPDWSKANRFGTQWASYEEALQLDGPHTVGETNFWKTHLADYGTDINNSAVINAYLRAQKAYQQKLLDAFTRLAYKETAFSMYNLVVDQSGLETALIALGGIDRMGNRIKLSDRILTVANFAGGIVLHKAFNAATLQDPIRKTVSRSGPAQEVVLVPPPGADLPADMKPKPLPPGATGTPPPAYPPAPLPKLIGANAPTKTGRFMPAGKENLSPLEAANPPPVNARTPGNARQAAPVDPSGTRYSKALTGEKVLDVDETHFAQVDNVSCTCAAVTHGLADLTQDDLIDDVIAKRKMPLTGAERPSLAHGVGYEELAEVLTENGYTSSLLEYSPNVGRQIKAAFESGDVVIVTVQYPNGGRHSIRVVDIVKDANGRTTNLKVFDPGPGDTRQFTVKQFGDLVQAAGKGYLADVGPGVAPPAVVIAIKPH